MSRGDNWYRNLLAMTSDQGAREAGECFWTGLPPMPGTPGVGEDGKIFSLPLLELAGCSRQSVLDYYDNTWTLTETLFSALNGNDGGAFIIGLRGVFGWGGAMG